MQARDEHLMVVHMYPATFSFDSVGAPWVLEDDWGEGDGREEDYADMGMDDLLDGMTRVCLDL